jgi:mannose-1-phosphate guanylyltransferase
MKALILVGGFGTRLRPLTFTVPKPCVPFCNKELVIHQIEALKKVGVDTVILAVSYKPDMMAKLLEPFETELGVRLIYSEEQEPLGTAGPIALARNYILEGNNDDPFFVLNSDITSTFPFNELLTFHKSHGKEGTIMVTKVTEPSKYGVVVYNESSGKISRFVEKPKEYVGNKINAGMYIFNKSILNRIPLQPTSIEQEVFPKMCEDGDLFAMELQGFWMDVGQPKDYITGMCKYLTHLYEVRPSELKNDSESFIQPVVVHPTAKIGKNCVIGPYVTIGPNCVVEDGVRMKRTTMLGSSTVRKNSWVENSIIGWESTVGRWCRVEGVTVLGRSVKIFDELYINGGIILDHKEIKESIPEPRVVI